VIKVFIGYDEVESVAYHTLCQSIIEYATEPVSITPVKLSMLPMYTRPRNTKQSNEFSFSRFLVPYLCNYEGHAIFMDCDMMFRTDVRELWNLIDDSKSVQVVKHDYTPSTQVKYLGAIQYPYPRKNWSSVMLFNCGHKDCRKLTPYYVNTAKPMELHRFMWTNDENIGSLPVEWNHLVGEYEENPDAKNVHWTLIGPWFYNEPLSVEHGSEWVEMKEKVDYAKAWREDTPHKEVS
jgi:lipopolysaccharide biosynthesis glycosyltransferase